MYTVSYVPDLRHHNKINGVRLKILSPLLSGVAMPDELKIVLEDVKEKFDTVIEAFNMVRERFDRHERPKRRDLRDWRQKFFLSRQMWLS